MARPGDPNILMASIFYSICHSMVGNREDALYEEGGVYDGILS